MIMKSFYTYQPFLFLSNAPITIVKYFLPLSTGENMNDSFLGKISSWRINLPLGGKMITLRSKLLYATNGYPSPWCGR